MMAYVDNFLLMTTTDNMHDHKHELLATLWQLGFIINYQKSLLEPLTAISFLQHILDSDGADDVPEIHVLGEKVWKLWKDIR